MLSAMQAKKRLGMILFLIATVCLSALADEKSDSALALIRQHLFQSVGKIPWNTADGYTLEGQFVLQAAGEEIPYRARYARASNRWAAEFSQDDPTRNLRYAFSGQGAWAGSPEITVDLEPAQLPYMARLDFYQLYDALLGILERGPRDPSFAAEVAANEIHVSGKLQNGWNATFVFNVVEFFPRKVLVSTGGKTAAWLLPSAKPDGSGSLRNVPGVSAGFEIWLSDPVDAGEYRYPRRMDFVENGNVAGTFFLEKTAPLAESAALFHRPPDRPWAGALRVGPAADSRRPSMYLSPAGLPEFRSRIKRAPWSGWSAENRPIVLWAIAVSWIGRILPHSLSFRLVLLAVAVFWAAMVFLLLRRRGQTGAPFRWGLLLAGFFIGCLVLPGWFAARQFHAPRDRGLLALHAAVRYAITGHWLYAGRADALLLDFRREAPAQSIEELGDSCQAYALAYDLIRSKLPRARQARIEEDLFNYAKPLFGASRGWRSDAGGSSVIASGLGMTGLALGYEPYIAAAREVLDKMLRTQLASGLHQSGPGPGSTAMDSAINLFYGLKSTGRADYYANAAFRKYLDTTLQMLSPVGTLPLFGDTSPDQSARLSVFFVKAAGQVSEQEGRQCLAAYERYRAHGRYDAGGWIRWILPAFQSLRMMFENPYLLFHYAREIQPSSLGAASAVLGDGQVAVLRAGEGADSAWLALNMARSGDSPHRDILTFDLYAYRSLLLHGPGSPGAGRPGYRESAKTAASNSITLNGEDQSAARCTGIESSLLNQPLFDYVRALADKTYDYGHVRRDAVMVRPEEGRPAYFLLIDDVFTTGRRTTVQWHLHGSGDLATGVGQASRWTAARFDAPRLRPDRVILEAAYPIGAPEKLSRRSGVLYSRLPIQNQNSEGVLIEWTGSKRFCSVLVPRKSKEAQTKIDALGESSCRVGATDWISLGRLDAETSAGALRHVSEYVVVRDRQTSFPALLMVTGLQCRFGLHSITSSKPVTASLKGLQGGFLNPRPDTRIEIRTPGIKAGDRFELDGRPVAADEPGVLRLTLANVGGHFLRRTN